MSLTACLGLKHSLFHWTNLDEGTYTADFRHSRGMVDWNKPCSAEHANYESAGKQYVGEARSGKARARNWSPLWNMPHGGVEPSFDAFPPLFVSLGCCWQRRPSSPSCLNENVPGAKSAADMAFHLTLPDHAGAEAGWESTVELVPHFYSSVDLWHNPSRYVNCKNGWTLQVWLWPPQRLPEHEEEGLVPRCHAAEIGLLPGPVCQAAALHHHETGLRVHPALGPAARGHGGTGIQHLLCTERLGQASCCPGPGLAPNY